MINNIEIEVRRSGEMWLFVKGVEIARVKGVTKEVLIKNLQLIEDAKLEASIRDQPSVVLRRTKHLSRTLRDSLLAILQRAKEEMLR